MRMTVGSQHAESLYYNSIVGKEAMLLPWVPPVWDKHGDYQEKECVRVHVPDGIRADWYIHQDDALGLNVENASYVALLKNEL